MSDLGQVHKVLESGYSNVPMPLDTEKLVIIEQSIWCNGISFRLGQSTMHHGIHMRRRTIIHNH